MFLNVQYGCEWCARTRKRSVLIATERRIVCLPLFNKLEQSGTMQFIAFVHPRIHDRVAQSVACATVSESVLADAQE